MQGHYAEQKKKKPISKGHIKNDIIYLTSRNSKIMAIGNKLVALGDRDGIDYKGVA